MSRLTTAPVALAGHSAHVLRGGTGNPVVFLHGGRPNLPYAAGAHLWGEVLDAFADRQEVVAPDLPGFGRTPSHPPGPASFAALVAFTTAFLEAALSRPAHLVGHDEGGLAALCVALDRPDLVRSLTVVSSAAAAPSGDSLENLTLAHPPTPLGGRASQAWALERLSFSHHHVTPALLDACLASGPSATVPEDESRFTRELQAAKARTYEAYRTTGIPVPVQLIWGTHDPVSSLEHAVTLHRLVGARQPATQCHVINRVGYFPFREAPGAFVRLVLAFLDGLAAERSGPAPAN